MGGLIYAWGEADLVGFRVRVGVKIKISLGTGSLVPVGGERAASISYPFFSPACAVSSTTKTSPNAGYFKTSLNKLLFGFFFFTGNIFAVNSSLSFTVTIAAPNLLFVRLM